LRRAEPAEQTPKPAKNLKTFEKSYVQAEQQSKGNRLNLRL